MLAKGVVFHVFCILLNQVFFNCKLQKNLGYYKELFFYFLSVSFLKILSAVTQLNLCVGGYWVVVPSSDLRHQV